MFGAVSGDTLLLQPGTYVDNYAVVVKGGVTIRSVEGPSSTIVRMEKGADIGVFFIFEAIPPPLLEGLTIAHGTLHSGLPGGGITIRNCSPTIQNNLIVGNVNGDIEGGGGVGCGIGVVGGAPIIRNNTIAGNHCDFGSIDLYACSALVEHNVVALNSIPPTGGGGISCDASPAAVIRENLFWGNLRFDIAPACLEQLASEGNVVADPLFCSPVEPIQDQLSGDWRVTMASPVAPGGPQAGWGAPLGMCPGSTPSQERSWGRLKHSYR